jgi:hypothetical protein
MPRSSSPPSYLEAITNELLAKYRKLDSVISHAPTKGSYHEKILRDVIRNYLPSTFSTGEGFVINIDSETSSQLDILIIDNLDPRSFGYKENDFYIASDLAVVCFGEVKTYAVKSDFIASFHKLVSAKLIIKDLPARVTSFMFCYDAHASEASFRAWVDEAIAKVPNLDLTREWHYPDYVFCFKKKVFLERKTVTGGFQYVAAIQRDSSSNHIQQLMMQELFQCVTNGCGRIRKYQGIRMFREQTPDGTDF